MKALLVKELNREKAECDIVLMFDDMKPIEVSFLRRGSILIAFMENVVQGDSTVRMKLTEK